MQANVWSDLYVFDAGVHLGGRVRCQTRRRLAHVGGSPGNSFQPWHATVWGRQTNAGGGGMDRAGTCTSFTFVKASLEVAPTTAAGVTHLQFPFQVCFSFTLPDLVFPVSLSLSADR